jgi:hypothetical protein
VSPAIVIGEECPYCCKFRSPLDIIRQPGGVAICTACEQRHLEALEAIATGNFLGECSECGLKAEELKAQKRCGPMGQMAVHFEAGKYRALCLECDRLYVPKRRELYGDTRYGHELGLK